MNVINCGMQVEALDCADGSKTLFVPELNETYHSRKGAITESQYVYIDAGLAQIPGSEIRILEFGFGTGLNALLTNQFAERNRKHISYTSCELHPLSKEVLAELNYTALLGMEKEWSTLHGCPWNRLVELTPFFQLHLFEGDFRRAPVEAGSTDLVYYDAFAPSKQAEVWSEEYLGTAHRALKKGGILVSYCAQGQFKRTLAKLGFSVETLAGPPGKAEMVRAVKIL